MKSSYSLRKNISGKLYREKLQQQKNDILKKQNNIFCEKVNDFHFISLENQKYIAKQMIEKINVFAEKAEFYWKI